MRSLKVFELIAFFYILTTIKSQEEELNIEMNAKEKDKILACAELSSQKFSKDNKLIEDISRSLPQVNRDLLTQKIYGEMLISCYHRITPKTVSTMFDNLSIVDVEWNDSYNNLLKVDYSKFRIQTADFQITPEQSLLFTKLQTVKEEYLANQNVRREEEKSSFKVFGYSLKSIPNSFKMVYFVVIFALFGIGIIYFLKKVMKTEKAEKKKKKNKSS